MKYFKFFVVCGLFMITIEGCQTSPDTNSSTPKPDIEKDNWHMGT